VSVDDGATRVDIDVSIDGPLTAWLGVVSADHVARGVGDGIAQIGHGKKGGLARMRPGDLLVYYSPRDMFGGSALRAFTAVGRVVDDEVWQADEGGFWPWRRRVDYDPDATTVPLAAVQDDLDHCRDPHWGYRLRRGLVELSDHDAAVLVDALTAGR
jgi:hypothetical protein